MHATEKNCIRILIFYWINLVFEAYRRLCNSLGIGGIWMSPRRVAIEGKSNSSDGYRQAQQAARQLLLMVNY